MDEFTANEFSKRYRDTVIISTARGIKEPLIVESINLLDNVFTARVHDNKDRALIPLVNLNVIEYPNKVCFDDHTKKSVLMYSRRPLRQWKKGFTSENTAMFDLSGLTCLPLTGDSSLTVRYKNPLRISIDMRNLKSLAQTEYPKILSLDSFTFLDTQLQKCLTSEFWISRTFQDKEITLFKFDTPLGVFNTETKSLRPFLPVFRQEAVDFVNRNGLSCYMEVV